MKKLVKIEDMKLTPYHEEKNKRTAETNNTMPKLSVERFKTQVQLLKDYRQAQGAITMKNLNKEQQLRIDREILIRILILHKMKKEKEELQNILEARSEALQHVKTPLDKKDKNMERSYLNDFHKKSSEASQKEVESMLKHPFSREEILAQVKRLTTNTEGKRKI